MLPLTITDRRRIERCAAEAPSLRRRLLAGPVATAEAILLRRLAPGLALAVIEEPPDALYFALPPLGLSMPLPEPETRRQLFENILLSWAFRDDGSLREQSVRDPRALYRALTGNDLDLPPEVQPVVLQDTALRQHVVLPRPSPDIRDELPDDLLELVAGGTAHARNPKPDLGL